MGVFAHVTSYFSSPSDKPYVAFLKQLADSGKGIDAIVANVIGLAIGSSVNYAQGMLLNCTARHEKY